jgi:hypothetical protein
MDEKEGRMDIQADSRMKRATDKGIRIFFQKRKAHDLEFLFWVTIYIPTTAL